MTSKIEIGTLFGLYLVGVIIAQKSTVTNIAFNKTVSQSSTYKDDPSRYGAMFAVNGQGCQTQNIPRFKSKDQYQSSWSVYLQRNYFIRNVTVTPSPESSETMKFNIFPREPRDQRDVCNYEEDGTRGPVYPCNEFGKIIILRRWDTGILSFCNVHISGDEVCDNPKLYGESCGTPCYTQCATNWCRKQDGRCDECNDGYYGVRCDVPCSTGCESAGCDKDNGRCDCKPRHNQIQGAQCLPCPTNCNNSCNQTLYCDHCKDGFYGNHCNITCSVNCYNDMCNRDGSCECKVGYAGNPCMKCPDTCGDAGCDNAFRCINCKPGYYGNHCNITCSVNCNNDTCNRDGSCECKPGYAGYGCCPENCLIGCNDSFVCLRCKSNYHGNECREKCPVNCLHNCSQSGDQCIECQNGYWGPLCQNNCPLQCDTGSCSQDNGTCACKPGYQGTSCQQKCNAGYYGEGCEQTCSDHCDEESCNHVNGSCNCKDGYTGNMCDERCVTNKWGSECNGTCHCTSDSCHHVNGSCSSGCADGWSGEACQMEAVSKPPVNLAAIGGGAGAGVAALLVGIIVIIVLRRRQNQSSKDESREFSPISTQPKLSPKISPNRQNSVPEEITTECSPANIYENMSITVAELPVYIQKMKEKGDGFQKEFKKLPTGLKFPTELGSKPENIKKNRFKNIISYDHSLVKLTQEGEDPNSTYVNANWIQNYEKQNTFIAAQGAFKKVEADFLKLMWEESIPLVVMVTKLVEDNANKCEPYWSDDPNISLSFGGISVSAKIEKQASHYIIRTLTLTKDEESRTLTQIQFTSWPDHGVPRSPASFLEFHKMAQQMYQPDIGPTLIHCSAGVGRTGTFLAVDYLLKQAAAENCVSVVQCLEILRKQRTNMVQSLDQYIFIYETVMEALHCGQTTYSTSTYGITWQGIHRAEFSKQFETLNKMKHITKDSELSIARDLVNAGKNSNPNVVPSNAHRVRLVTVLPHRNDYINAVFVHGHQRKNEFVVTQWPLVNTEVDFWRLCLDYRGATVIALHNLDSKSQAEYWPNVTAEAATGPFMITKVHETAEGNHITRDLTCKFKKNSQNLRQFMVNIPTNGLPEISKMLEVYEFAKRWHHNQQEATCIMHCGDGADTSGLFLALWLICDKITDEQEVDVFHAVKQIRATRPQFVVNLEQYMWLHQAAESYIDSFSSYGNFK